jgi:uncharacterized protein
MRNVLILSCLLLLSMRPAFADPLQDAQAAYSQKDYPQALYLFKPLAEQGNVAAQRQLAMMYYKAQGTKKDETEALKWFLAAANQGNLSDELTVALYYQKDGDYGKSLKESGALGTPAQDYAEARKWFQKCADQGSAPALRYLGDMYQVERGVEQDYKQAAGWYIKAANAGDATAQYELGILYKKGLGVGPTDNVKALMWLTLAASRGSDQATGEKDFLSRTMMADDIAQANKLAKEWTAKPYTPPSAADAAKAQPPAQAAPAAETSAAPAPAAPVAPPPAQNPASPDPNAAPAP